MWNVLTSALRTATNMFKTLGKSRKFVQQTQLNIQFLPMCCDFCIIYILKTQLCLWSQWKNKLQPFNYFPFTLAFYDWIIRVIWLQGSLNLRASMTEDVNVASTIKTNPTCSTFANMFKHCTYWSCRYLKGTQMHEHWHWYYQQKNISAKNGH